MTTVPIRMLERNLPLPSVVGTKSGNIGVQSRKPERKQPSPAGKRTAPETRLESLDEFRRQHIEHALRTAGGDIQRAARLLGISAERLDRWKRKLRIKRDDKPAESQER